MRRVKIMIPTPTPSTRRTNFFLNLVYRNLYPLNINQQIQVMQYHNIHVVYKKKN